MNGNLLSNKLNLALVVCLVSAISAFGQLDVTTLQVVEDVYVSQQEPSKNFNGVTDLGVAIDETNGDSRETYLKFDISALSGKGGLVSADLSIMTSVKNEAPWHQVDNIDINIYGCTNPWSEKTLTWDNKVEADPEVIAEKGIQQMARFIINGTKADTASLKKYIEEAMKQHLQYVSFVIKGKVETPAARIWISDMGWEPAKLIVTQDYILNEPGATEVFISSITLASRENKNAITTDNGTLSMIANILPADASNKRVKWSVQNGTGKASISPEGVLTAIKDGTVTVVADAIDGSWAQGTTEITISGQKYTFDERNYIIDGTFTTNDAAWYGDHYIDNGICSITSNKVYPNCWDYAFNQKLNVPLDKKDLDYIFSFKAWSDETRTFNVDMEDFNNGYERYGTSTDPQSWGASDWTFDLTTTPTVYVFHVNFKNMRDNCSQNMKFNIGLSTATVYLDSVLLMTVEDYATLGNATKANTINANSLKIYPNPVGLDNELNVALMNSNEKVAIYNSMGQKVMEKVAYGNVVRFNVSGLSKGMYIVRLNDGTSRKFIK